MRRSQSMTPGPTTAGIGVRITHKHEASTTPRDLDRLLTEANLRQVENILLQRNVPHVTPPFTQGLTKPTTPKVRRRSFPPSSVVGSGRVLAQSQALSTSQTLPSQLPKAQSAPAAITPAYFVTMPLLPGLQPLNEITPLLSRLSEAYFFEPMIDSDDIGELSNTPGKVIVPVQQLPDAAILKEIAGCMKYKDPLPLCRRK